MLLKCGSCLKTWFPKTRTSRYLTGINSVFTPSMRRCCLITWRSLAQCCTIKMRQAGCDYSGRQNKLFEITNNYNQFIPRPVYTIVESCRYELFKVLQCLIRRGALRIRLFVILASCAFLRQSSDVMFYHQTTKEVMSICVGLGDGYWWIIHQVNHIAQIGCHMYVDWAWEQLLGRHIIILSSIQRKSSRPSTGHLLVGSCQPSVTNVLVSASSLLRLSTDAVYWLGVCRGFTAHHRTADLLLYP